MVTNSTCGSGGELGWRDRRKPRRRFSTVMKKLFYDDSKTFEDDKIEISMRQHGLMS